jgi:hypothetical protein
VDDVERWLIGDIWMPLVLCVVTIVAGFLVVKAIVKKTKQKNVARIKGNNNYVVQMNEPTKSGNEDDKKSSED